jgi:FixJ family two-component response regulator
MKQPPVTIYIVEDDDSMRRALERLMLSAGYATATFASVGEFIATECFLEPACVIADARMPGGSGLDLLEKLRARGSGLPVIIVTAHATPEIRAQARQAGVDGYFRKPVDDQALIDAIEWALSGRHQSTNLAAADSVKRPHA